MSSNLLSTVHRCVCLERIFFVNGAQHSSQCGSYNLLSWLLWVELSCVSTTNIFSTLSEGLQQTCQIVFML